MYYKSRLSILLFFVFAALMAPAIAQTAVFEPDMTVSGIRLGDRASARAALAGYNGRRSEDGKAEYYFYNSYGTTVMRLTAASYEDPHFITEAEVFGVGKTYQNKHWQLEKIGHFITESGIFVGFRQSGKGITIALLTGVPNLSRDNMIGPKDVVRKKGEPATRAEESKDIEIFRYEMDQIAVPDDASRKYSYSAMYRFKDKKLTRYLIKISPQLIAKQ